METPNNSARENFTDMMRQELRHCRFILAHEGAGPFFQWDRYNQLLMLEQAEKDYIATVIAEAKHALQSPPIGPIPMSLAFSATDHDTVLKEPAYPNSPKESPVQAKSDEPAPSLESICKGADGKRQAEVAQKIDAIWEYAKSIAKTEAHYPAICVAIYKLAVMLDKVDSKNDVKARDWRRTLETRYGVSISEGIAKYSLENPKSAVFKRAVKLVFDFVSTQYPLWVRGKDLPAIYR
ncbi:MAG: hypothetical protein ACRYFX_22290 [Janthinobacterium lividum]